MNQSISLSMESIQSKASAWWASKTPEQQLELETHLAIAAPKIGTILGMLLVVFVL